MSWWKIMWLVYWAASFAYVLYDHWWVDNSRIRLGDLLAMIGLSWLIAPMIGYSRLEDRWPQLESIFNLTVLGPRR